MRSLVLLSSFILIAFIFIAFVQRDAYAAGTGGNIGCLWVDPKPPGKLQQLNPYHQFDKNIIDEAAYQNGFWHTKTSIVYYVDSPQNALSAPSGWVYLGLNMTKWLVKSDPTQATLSLVIAHEWAHQVQFQHFPLWNTYKYSISRELQADCLAGYYMGRYKNTNWYNMQPAFTSLCTMADPPSVPYFHPQAHGTCRQRLYYAQVGFYAGYQARAGNYWLTWQQLVEPDGICTVK